MNIKEIEKVVASIQAQLFKKSNSHAIGMFKSHFKGAGLQFKEHQLYNAGDDVRFIDWKLSAKSSKTYVKTFEEERNIEIVVILDLSESMQLGFKGKSKLDACVEIACLLFLLADKSKDKVKIVLFSKEVSILPPLSGQGGIAQFISFLEKKGIVNQSGKMNIFYDYSETVEEKKRLATIKAFIAKGKEVVYLSDFSQISDKTDLEKLIYRKNMHCFRVVSPIELASTKSYSLWGISGNKGKLKNINKIKQNYPMTGRWSQIDVSTRYLEDFVKEML